MQRKQRTEKEKYLEPIPNSRIGNNISPTYLNLKMVRTGRKERHKEE